MEAEGIRSGETADCVVAKLIETSDADTRPSVEENTDTVAELVEQVKTDDDAAQVDSLDEKIESDFNAIVQADTLDSVIGEPAPMPDLEKRVKYLSEENTCLHTVIEEKAIEEVQLKDEIAGLKNALKSKESEETLLNAKIQQLQNDYKIKLEHFQESQKDKTGIIMKYAEAEKRCIDLNRTIDMLQNKIKNTLKEKQTCIEKCEQLQCEKQKLNENLSGLRQNLDKVKEQSILTDAKLNITQTKLKLEIAAHTETKSLYDKLLVDYDKKSLNDNDELVNKKINDKHSDLIEEVNTLKDKLNFYENDYKNHESSISKYNETLQSQKQLNKDLLTEILQLRELQAVLKE
jgi:hypothetical protein